jgi:hypothetical protein
MNGEGQEEKGGVFTGEVGESAFAFSVAIHESDNKLGNSLWCSNSEMRRYEERHTLAAAQGACGETTEDKFQDIVYEGVYFVPLIGGLLHLN